MQTTRLASPVSFALLIASMVATGCADSSLPSNPTDGSGGTGGALDGGVDKGGGGGGSGGAAGSVDEACGKLAAARCTQLKTCTGGIGLQRAFADDAQCLERVKLACAEGQAQKGTGATPASASACAAAVAAEACADYLSGKDLPECGAIPGMLDAGAGCATSSQCMTAHCAIRRGSLCGTCGTPPLAGDNCTDFPCGPGLACGANDKCAPPVASGGECDRNRPCDAGLGCVGTAMMGTTPGKCQPLVAMAGAACDPMRRTTAACDLRLGLYCDPMSRTCAMLTLAAPGGTCGAVAGMLVGCSAGAACDAPPMTMGMPATGTCIAAAAEAGACDTDKGPPCLFPALCETGGSGATAGICRLRTAAACP